MKYSTKTGTLTELRTSCLVAGRKSATSAARAMGAKDLYATATADFKDKVGETLLINLPGAKAIRRVLLVGGLDESLSTTDFRKAVRAAADRLKTVPARDVLWSLTHARVTGEDAYWKTATALTALSTALYTFDLHKSKPAETPASPVNRIAVHADARTRALVARAVRHGQAAKAKSLNGPARGQGRPRERS